LLFLPKIGPFPFLAWIVPADVATLSNVGATVVAILLKNGSHGPEIMVLSLLHISLQQKSKIDPRLARVVLQSANAAPLIPHPAARQPNGFIKSKKRAIKWL
jgi:hypothetical protein